MKPIRHINLYPCPKCEVIFERYNSFNAELMDWFWSIQMFDPTAHISCAGRGEKDQNELFERKLSKAKWKESAHNFNAAIDIFRQLLSGTHYERPWFEATVGSFVMKHNASSDAIYKLDWYGLDGHKFEEFPHVQIKDWRNYNFTAVE